MKATRADATTPLAAVLPSDAALMPPPPWLQCCRVNNGHSDDGSHVVLCSGAPPHYLLPDWSAADPPHPAYYSVSQRDVTTARLLLLLYSLLLYSLPLGLAADLLLLLYSLLPLPPLRLAGGLLG